jgi:hypothetical protein
MIHRPINLEHAAEAMDDRSALGGHSSRPMRHLDADADDLPEASPWTLAFFLAVFFVSAIAYAVVGSVR